MPANETYSFNIISLENKEDLSLVSKLRKNPLNELFFITGGYLVRDCNLRAIRINRSDFHTSSSKQITDIRESSPDLSGYYCCFDDSFLEHVHLEGGLESELAYISSFMYRYPLRLDKKVFERLDFIFKTMYGLASEHCPDYKLLHAYLVAVIYEVKKLMVENGLNPYPSKAFLTVKRFNDLLSEYIDKERSIDFYAKQLSITPNHLNKSIKATTGRTAISLLNEMALREAKLQLIHTDKPIGIIAFELGFEDQAYFSRFFKKATGMTPLKFRKSQ